MTFLISLGVIVLDQGTKFLAKAYISPGEHIRFIPYFMDLTYTENKGASFGMLAENRWVFMVASTVAIIGIIVFLIKYREVHPSLQISMALILGGGVGNMIDRVFRGAVIDFFEFSFVNFAIFNVADMFITFGAIILGIYLIFYYKKDQQKPEN